MNKFIHFSGTVVDSDDGDPGQTDPVEQAAQNSHCQRHHNTGLTMLTDTVFFFFFFFFDSVNGDPGQTDPVDQSDQDPHCKEVHNKAIEQLDLIFKQSNQDMNAPEVWLNKHYTSPNLSNTNQTAPQSDSE